MSKHYLIGWDIGGAHVKVATVDKESGVVVNVLQESCPLWKGLDYLKNAVATCRAKLPAGHCHHAVTMTGELVDLFNNRNEGVARLIEAMQQFLPDEPLAIFAGRLGLLNVQAVKPQHYADIASTNWLASVRFAARHLPEGLLVDIGSTTTDVLAFKNGLAQPQGLTDYQRLATQELVYTGVVRTAVMALTPTVVDEGQQVGVMAEYFATMADVYRLTGELNEAHDQADTADGAEKTSSASARRLARMIGCDFITEELPRWVRLADHLRGLQLQKIESACNHLIKTTVLNAEAPMIGAGIGRFLVQALAEQLARPYQDFSALCLQPLPDAELATADCAPAVALVYLLRDYAQ